MTSLWSSQSQSIRAYFYVMLLGFSLILFHLILIFLLISFVIISLSWCYHNIWIRSSYLLFLFVFIFCCLRGSSKLSHLDMYMYGGLHCYYAQRKVQSILLKDSFIFLVSCWLNCMNIKNLLYCFNSCVLKCEWRERITQYIYKMIQKWWLHVHDYALGRGQ